MAIAYVQEVGKGQQAGAGSTLVVTVASAPAANSLVVGRVCVDGGQTVSSVADTRGNTWLVDIQTTAGPCASIISTTQQVAKLQASDTITVTLGGSTGQTAAIFDEFSGVDTSATRVDKTATGSAATTARDAGTTAATTQNDELVVGCFVIGNTETSLTAGATYSDFTTKFTGTATSTEGVYKIVSATGAQNPTATGSNNSSKGCVATYKQAASVATSTLYYVRA